ncbi:hypothetical protein KBC80_00135 [Candidatus Woesebacteria bacterium]|nr:hypothetical protein [Candidatus Woesebacteria bacterium]
MKISAAKIKSFQNMIFLWWKQNRRNLPWRKTNDPYRILISEVMLQQTQVSRVLSKYEEFLYFFPDVYALARATPAKVLRIWRGMGYNRRALYLKKTAEEVVNTYSGYFPESESELLKLSGVGKYTARAIMVFANRAQVSMIDTNIRQIIVHYFFNGFPQKEKAVEAVADQLVPRDKSWEWHQALMDYGALELKNVIDTTKKVKKSVAVPFKESNRYFRGRVIDALRQKSWEEKKLIAYTSDYYKKSPSFVKKIIDGLLKDGLLERSKKLLQLPLS